MPINSLAFNGFQELRKGRKGKGHIFLDSEAKPVRGHRDWFDLVVKSAELEDYTWHCNRHTFASRLVMAGVDLRTVAQLMGHKTIQMTMRYAHLAPDHQQNAVERLVPLSAPTKEKPRPVGKGKRAGRK